MLNLIPVSYSLQIISALIIASVIFRYYKVYQREYLKFWSFSFFSLTIFLTLALLLSQLRSAGFVYTGWGMYLLSLAKINAGYLQIAWLFLGTFTALKSDSQLVKNKSWLLLGVIGLATLLGSLFAFDADGGIYRNVIRSGSRYALGGLAFLLAALSLIIFSKRQSLGKKIVSLAFLLYGLEMSYLGYLNIRIVFGGDWKLLTNFVQYHGVFELLIYPIIGLGLVIWLLETERHQRMMIYEKLAALNHSDPLTGLANRQGFEQWLSNWLRVNQHSEEKLLMMLLGIDQFKRINDSGGVRQGDEVLVALANRMNSEIIDISDKARISGDVFACILSEDIAHPENLEWFRRRFSRPLTLANQQIIHIDVSIGATWFDGTSSFDQALMQAQIALQQAKQSGGKKALLFDNTMPQTSNSLELENELRLALAENQFKIFLQPIYQTKDESIIGFEALVRWERPDYGIASPIDFLPTLSQLQLLPELDLWILEQSVERLKTWQNNIQRDIFISVNLSAESLQNDRYLQEAPGIIGRLGEKVHLLHLEITENSAMKSINAGKYSLAQLRELGLKIAIDDFGTGYSSLNYLKSFPSDKIKFDRSFIAEMNEDQSSLSILRALVPLCQQLGKEVLAEGIEMESQLQMAKAIGFDQLQGYYFSKPLPIKDAEKLLIPNNVTPINTNRSNHSSD